MFFFLKLQIEKFAKTAFFDQFFRFWALCVGKYWRNVGKYIEFVLFACGPTIGVESQKQKSTYVVFRNFRDIIHNRGAKAFLEFFSRYEYLMGLYGKITCPQTKKEPLIVEKNELDCVE